MTGQVLPGKTTIMKEYSHAYEPGSGQTPYYAILDPDNRKLYGRYLERVRTSRTSTRWVVWPSIVTTIWTL